jgi:two-component system phosphate regulon sensor histidine kinase PhoR
MGIPEQDLPRIFERFYRGSVQRYGGAPGSGLGLAFVESIVREHDGAITVTSEVGKGSCFTLVFPDSTRARS